jgi:hypothetical protein
MGRTVGQYMDGYNGLDRITVAEAAQRLGVKEQAIRKRISRGTLRHDKAEDGRVYVYVDAEVEDEVQGKDTRDDTYRDALVESLQDQNRFLREELARKDAILMNMTQTMRQITAPSSGRHQEHPRAPQTSNKGAAAPPPIPAPLRRPRRPQRSPGPGGVGCSEDRRVAWTIRTVPTRYTYW